MSMLRLPGIVDAHVHLREPGATHKEDILSGTMAALAGGVVAVMDMPNNHPPAVDRATFAPKHILWADRACCDYGLFLGYAGGPISEMVDLAPHAVGLKLYLDETFGDLLTDDPHVLERVFEAWPGPGPIAVHADSDSIAMAIGLAERHGQHLHVCHVPHPDDLLAIDDARQRGVRVTCEVTPHHLFLSQEAEERIGAYAQMKPPLLLGGQVSLFWERLNLIDIIASDHAPHTRAEKGSASPPPGVPGLETALPLLLYAVEQGRLSQERMVELVCTGPLRVFGLRPPADSHVEIEVGRPYRLPFEGYVTRCGWSPFVDQWALGQVHRVCLRGETAWERGELAVSPGYGRRLQRCDGR